MNADVAAAHRRQRLRLWLRTGFFALFVLAPVLDVFRLDLTRGHFVLFGQDWTLGIDDFVAGRIDAQELSLRVVLRAFVPGLVFVVGGLWLAWKYGRLYCGWLCPHWSVVETINANPVQHGLISAKGVVTERFSRWDDKQVTYEFTVEDASLYTQPWRGEMSLNHTQPWYEYACHEGNYALTGILSGARARERGEKARTAN